MIHNSVIIELPGSSFQHRKYVVKQAAAPLQNKSIRASLLFKAISCRELREEVIQFDAWLLLLTEGEVIGPGAKAAHAAERSQTFKRPNRNSPPAEKLSCSYWNKPGWV